MCFRMINILNIDFLKSYVFEYERRDWLPELQAEHLGLNVYDLQKGSGMDKNKRHIHPHVRCSSIHNSQGMETTQMSIDR